MKARRFYPLIVLAAALFLAECATAAPPSAPFDLTILHVNDTHSMLEPSPVRLTVDLDPALTGKAVYVSFGGFPAAMAAVTKLRSESPGSVLFLHAGDLFQGSLYFTKYLGAADVDFWNAMKLDVATLGNHEFDKGPGLIQTALLDKAAFAVTSANVDFSKEPAVTSKEKIPPFVIEEIGGQKIGIIGVTTPETPFISSPGKNVVFREAAASVNTAVTALEAKGVNKIIALTHVGFEADKALAAAVHHVDLIVGGHSHTLLGSYPSIGLKGVDSYPFTATDADGQNVLIVQAWQWAYEIGRLRVSFDAAGKIVSFDARPVLVVNKGFARIYDLPNTAGEKKRVQFTERAGQLEIKEYDGSRYAVAVTGEQYEAYAAAYGALGAKLSSDSNVVWTDPDPAGQGKLDAYAAGVSELRNKVAANITEDMKRGENSGPGPIIADSMVWKTDAQVAIMNPGGVRTDLTPGDLTVARVYELQPFGNTLVTATVTGQQLVSVLEDMADFTVTGYGKDLATHHLYVSGVTLSLDAGEVKGKRITDVQVRQKDGAYAPLDPAARYTLVVNSFMAAGGDKNATLAGLAGKYDTGYIDSEAMLAYIEGKSLANLPEVRVKRIR